MSPSTPRAPKLPIAVGRAAPPLAPTDDRRESAERPPGAPTVKPAAPASSRRREVGVALGPSTSARQSSQPSRPSRLKDVTGSEGMSLTKPTSLSALAKESLRARIISGEMRANHIYSVPSLAAAFGVSATPVREALLELASEGLMEAVPNQGFRVVQLSEKDLDHIFEIRVMLEVPGLVQVARGGLSPADLRRYAGLAAEIERYAAAGETVGYLRADRAFHLGLLAMLGNERLVSMVAELRDQARLYGLGLLIERGELLDSAREHSQVVDAVARHDLEAVESLTRYHMEHTRGIWAQATEGTT